MKKILIVDDETSIRSLCYDLFTKDGKQVMTASRGDQALGLIAAEKFDLALLDIQIPGENGLALLAKMLQKDPRLPVVVFSGRISPELEMSAFGAGAAEVINKAVDFLTLREKMKKFLGAERRFLRPPPESKQGKILIVDDEAPVRKLLSEFFIRKGFQVVEAKTGEEAAALVRSEKPTVILLDIMMPGMDGISTLRKIREFDKDVGVIFATAVHDERIAREAAALGSYHYILKPFDLKYLELVVMTRLALAAQ